MILYKFDTDGIFLGEYPANADGYIPAGFTEIAPNKTKGEQVNIFKDGKWVTVLSCKGKKYYSEKDGTEVINTSHLPMSKGYRQGKPTVPNPTWNGTEWVTNEKLSILDSIREEESRLMAINVRLPNGKGFSYGDLPSLLQAKTQLDITGDATIKLNHHEYSYEDILYAILCISEESKNA